MSRAHYRAPVQDFGGNILAGSVVSVFQTGTTTLLTSPVWADGESSTALSNPFTSVDGIVNFYLDIPQRVDLGVQPPGQSQTIFPDIDVNLAAADSAALAFPGSGASSTALGSSAIAAGSQSAAFGDSASAGSDQSSAFGQGAEGSAAGATAVGQSAQAAGLQSTALGAQSAAGGAQSTTVGSQASAAGNAGTAAGANSSAAGVNSTALGTSASAPGTHSTALGAGASTTENQQVRLGTPTDYVDIPSFVTLLSDNAQIKFRLYLTDAGILYTRYHFPLDGVNLLTGNDGSFDAGIGAWAAGSNATAGATSAFTRLGSAGALLITQTAAGPAYDTSPQKAVTPNSFYIGKAWLFRHAGDGSATQFQAWLAWFDSGATLIGSAVAGPPQTILNDNWIVADVRAQAPSNAAFAALRIGVPSGGANTDKIYADLAGIFLAATDA